MEKVICNVLVVKNVVDRIAKSNNGSARNGVFRMLLSLDVDLEAEAASFLIDVYHPQRQSTTCDLAGFEGLAIYEMDPDVSVIVNDDEIGHLFDHFEFKLTKKTHGATVMSCAVAKDTVTSSEPEILVSTSVSAAVNLSTPSADVAIEADSPAVPETAAVSEVVSDGTDLIIFPARQRRIIKIIKNRFGKSATISKEGDLIRFNVKSEMIVTRTNQARGPITTRDRQHPIERRVQNVQNFYIKAPSYSDGRFIYDEKWKDKFKQLFLRNGFGDDVFRQFLVDFNPAFVKWKYKSMPILIPGRLKMDVCFKPPDGLAVRPLDAAL